MRFKWYLKLYQKPKIWNQYPKFVILIINMIIYHFNAKTLSSFHQLGYNCKIIMCRWIVFKKCRWVVFNCVDELSPKTVSMSCLVDELSCSRSGDSTWNLVTICPVAFIDTFFSLYEGVALIIGSNKYTLSQCPSSKKSLICVIISVIKFLHCRLYLYENKRSLYDPCWFLISNFHISIYGH